MSSNEAAQKTMHDVFVEQINEALNDIDVIEDFYVDDVDADPDLVDIVIRGRLKSDIGKGDVGKRFRKEKDDDHTTYDRAMKGIT